MKHALRSGAHFYNSIAFAPADGGTGGKSANKSGAGLPPAAAPEAGTITKPRADVALPEIVRKAGRGGSSPYPFDTLEIGQSFGVVGKTKKQISSTVFGANKRNSEPAKNADGSAVMKRKTKKDGSAEMVEVRNPLKLFEARDVDPKTDPDGASVRVWRKALPAPAAPATTA